MRITFWTGIAVAGLGAGIGDTLLAVGMYHVSPIRIYQSVASGLLGREAALGGGLATAGLGMLLHFFIATTAAAVFFAASTRLRWLVERAVPCGLGFGVAVYFFMKDVVVPLSAARPGPFSWTAMVGHAFLVGLPIAVVARRALVSGRLGRAERRSRRCTSWRTSTSWAGSSSPPSHRPWPRAT